MGLRPYRRFRFTRDPSEAELAREMSDHFLQGANVRFAPIDPGPGRHLSDASSIKQA